MKTGRIHNVQGFTLLELLIALVVLAFGLMGVSGMILTSVRGNALGAKTMQATALAQDKIEVMRNTDYKSLYGSCGTAGYPFVCSSPPATMADSAAPNDSGTSGDELTGGVGDGIWTYKYNNATVPLPTGMTLVWGVRRNYPQPKMIWLMALVQWQDNVQTTQTKIRTICTSKAGGVAETVNIHSICVESVLTSF